MSVRPTTWVQYFVFTLHWGYFAGLSGIVGHELLHKRETINKLLGNWSYTKFMYSHFLDEHINGHHRHIATLEDPATARRDETIYMFIPRSVIGGMLSTWNRESRRIERRNKGQSVGTI